MPWGMGVLVRHAMTNPVVTVRPESSLARALSLLRRHQISGLPVVDGPLHVVGVLSEKDIARVFSEAASVRTDDGMLEIFLRSGSKEVFLHSYDVGSGELLHLGMNALRCLKVREAMTPAPVTISPEASLDEAARIMNERRIRRLPVVEHGRLVGILTRHDVLGALELRPVPI